MLQCNNNSRSLLLSILLVVASSASIGCFFIPASYKNVGILTGTVISLLVGAFSVLSMKILAKASVKTGAESYGTLLYYAYSGEINSSIFNENGLNKTMFSLPRIFDMFIFLDCLFCVPIFILVLSNLLTQILPFIGNYNNYLFMFGSKTAMISITSLVLLPICIPVKYFNWIGIVFVTMFSVLFCFYVILNNLYGFIFKNDIEFYNIYNLLFNKEKYYTFESIFNCISLFNICIFTFFSQFNIIPAASRLYNPSNFRIRLLTAFTGIILVFSYSLMSMFSYIVYGSATKEFILDNFSHSSNISLIARLLVVFSMFLLLPLHIYPMIDALTNVIDNNYIEQINESNVSESSLPLISKKDNNKNVKKISFIRTNSGRILLLSILLALSYFIAIYFRDYPSYLVIMAGGFVDSIFVFLFPTLIHYRLVKNKNERFTSSPLRMALLLLFLISVSGSINCLLSVLNVY
ncbi:amino acid permease like integral membrane proteinplus 11 transmembrane domain [Cryptosporidium ryanae]|uniref:amino acid permease like integral membrane proteinplus 11 transmembrane domain n=1 Tax=Cryptosporidium ryanae TaxID=515981 RepID=UPI003519F04E|nr:amino acid permease like integral membrane proteinplus 11 transmembrane domain [Cryptosporidium ryanae]